MTTGIKPPDWYTGSEIAAAMERGEFRWVPPDRIEWLARHFQLAFNKGFSLAINTPHHENCDVNDRMIPGKPCNCQGRV